jgi:AbrB family looped-hinge helix DNA binding protein
MPISTLTTKGQTTIPKDVRDTLGVGPGDRLEFVIGPDREVVLRAATVPVSALRGILHRRGRKPVPLEAMAAAIRGRAGGRA